MTKEQIENRIDLWREKRRNAIMNCGKNIPWGAGFNKNRSKVVPSTRKISECDAKIEHYENLLKQVCT